MVRGEYFLMNNSDLGNLRKYFGVGPDEVLSAESIRSSLLSQVPVGSKKDKVLGFLRASGIADDKRNFIEDGGASVWSRVYGPAPRTLSDILVQYDVHFVLTKTRTVEDIQVQQGRT